MRAAPAHAGETGTHACLRRLDYTASGIEARLAAFVMFARRTGLDVADLVMENSFSTSKFASTKIYDAADIKEGTGMARTFFAEIISKMREGGDAMLPVITLGTNTGCASDRCTMPAFPGTGSSRSVPWPPRDTLFSRTAWGLRTCEQTGCRATSTTAVNNSPALARPPPPAPRDELAPPPVATTFARRACPAAACFATGYWR